MTEALPPVLDVARVAELLRCSTKTVEERARRGDLPGLKIGDSWVFPAGALLKRLDELALEESAERRRPAKTAATVVESKQRGKRTPPVLIPIN